MLYPFCTNLKDDETGQVLVYDFECDLHISVERGAPVINAMVLNGRSLIASDDGLSKLIGHRVTNAAEAALLTKGDLYQSVMEDWRMDRVA